MTKFSAGACGHEEYPILLSNIDIIQAACDELKKSGLPVALLIVDSILQMLGVKRQGLLRQEQLQQSDHKNNRCG